MDVAIAASSAGTDQPGAHRLTDCSHSNQDGAPGGGQLSSQPVCVPTPYQPISISAYLKDTFPSGTPRQRTQYYSFKYTLHIHPIDNRANKINKEQ